MSDRAAALCLLAALTVPGVSGTLRAQDTAWRPADSSYVWGFPRDHWAHPGYKTEWWYFTGQLTPLGAAQPRFGYQFTFFRIGLVPVLPALASTWTAKDLIMGHAALTDLTTGRHVFSELLYRASPLLGGFGVPGDSVIAWSRGPAGSDATWQLAWNGAAFTFHAQDDRAGLQIDLATAPSKPLVFQGPNGYSRKGADPDAASQYYSFTRLRTEGTVALDGDTVAVTGVSWMDKEFGSNQLSAGQIGWDWFSLQLDDGRELMLYHLRSADGSADYRRGTLVEQDGSVRFLQDGAWTATGRGQWRSDASAATYPLAWTIVVPSWGLEIEVTPTVRAQENVSRLVPGLAYWEGAVVVRDTGGRVIGRGYVELTGYAEGGRLPI